MFSSLFYLLPPTGLPMEASAMAYADGTFTKTSFSVRLRIQYWSDIDTILYSLLRNKCSQR